jgi:hypothetical protein
MPRKLLKWVGAAGIVLLVHAGAAGAVPVGGIEVDQGVLPVPGPGGAVIEREGCGTFIDFDDAPQPCAFQDTNPLRNEYQGLGVLFSAPNDVDGGAILDECSNFGVNGHSSPNFLAFNCGASMMNGGMARGPEYVSFTSAVSSVAALVGTGINPGFDLIMEAYDVNQQLIGSDSVTLQPSMQLISIAAAGIRSVIVGTTGPCIWVLDDLCLDFAATPVEPTTWGAVKSVFK